MDKSKRVLRCAIYTRKSTEHNLDLEFNSLDAQREACEAYIKSQTHEGWHLIPTRYDDGAFSSQRSLTAAHRPISPSRRWRRPCPTPGPSKNAGSVSRP